MRKQVTCNSITSSPTTTTGVLLDVASTGSGFTGNAILVESLTTSPYVSKLLALSQGASSLFEVPSSRRLPLPLLSSAVAYVVA